MWVWSKGRGQVYPPHIKRHHFLLEKLENLGPVQLWNDYYQWKAVWIDILGTFFPWDAELWLFSISRVEQSLAFVVWLAKSVVPTDVQYTVRNEASTVRPWDHSWNRESHSGTVRVERSYNVSGSSKIQTIMIFMAYLRWVWVIHVWQSRVEIEHYSVAYFDRIAAFEAL